MKAALFLVKDVGSSQIVPDILIWQKKLFRDYDLEWLTKQQCLPKTPGGFFNLIYS